MSYLVVIPSIYPPYTEACLTSMTAIPRDRVLVVDNAPPAANLGVAASWNQGLEQVLGEEADWLILCSAAIRFGPPGGADFLSALRRLPETTAIEAGWGLGWHLISFPRRTLETVGRFDENFWPGYYEDLDYARRIHLAGLTRSEPPWWQKVDVDAHVASFAHAERFVGVKADAGKLVAYYTRKWGGSPGAEIYSVPFGDASHDLAWWPEPEPEPVA